MKLIYSHLQKFLPDLNVEPQKLRDDLTMIGHFCNFYEEIEDEIVFDLDIKVNRGDCLGYYGLAKDLSIYYQLELSDIASFNFPKSNYALPIKVETENANRVTAVKIVHLQNKSSPLWLQKFVRIHGSNSINTLVDLSNYAMFMFGIPNHAFDTAKSTDKLIWQMNPRFTALKSLDGTMLKLDKNVLMVNNQAQALSLSFWGGESCAIDMNTTNTIIEMAIYNPTIVRQNSRQLKASTEASTRLEKFLDPNILPTALKYLTKLIIDNCGGTIGSQVFDYYPNPAIPTEINFDPKLPAIVSGIDIPEDFALDIVAKVGSRPDINLEADLVEEVVRFYGYNNIPANQPLIFKDVKNITPVEIYQIDELKDKLVAQGYDEVLTWPLVDSPEKKDTVITTQNSINSESIYLRQSLIHSLQKQLNQYQKYKMPNPKFFEIGKIFYQENGNFIEKTALGTYDGYKFEETILDNLDKPINYIPSVQHNTAIELTSQIITLDANVTLEGTQEPTILIKKYSDLIDSKILWSMEITDIFENKYTFRVCYYNCDDKTAKKIHLSTFNLSTEKYNYIDPKTPTLLQYYNDMYQTEFDATIINIKSNSIILDQTIFFPEGGGQPSDIGTVNNLDVTKLIFKDEQVLHEIKNHNFSVGDKVKLKLDWESRYKFMKIHSAGHLLHEVLLELDPNLIAIKGYHHDEAFLTYQGKIKTDGTKQIETIFNQKVADNLPIVCDYTDIETLTKDSRSVPKNLPLHKKLRRLKIGNYPSMADGGIQVKSTEEIGNIKITKIININNKSTIYYQLV